MTYRISYDDGSVSAAGAVQYPGGTRTEYFHTHHEALNRARQLIDEGDHHAVALHDGSGEVLAGVRLQLRLGASTAE